MMKSGWAYTPPAVKSQGPRGGMGCLIYWQIEQVGQSAARRKRILTLFVVS